MLLFCSGLNAELDHLRGFLRYAVLLALGGVLLTTLVRRQLVYKPKSRTICAQYDANEGL